MHLKFLIRASGACLLALGALLSGCGSSGAPVADVTKGAGQPARVASLDRDLVEGVPMGKPVAPVGVKFGLSGTPVAGTPFKVTLVVSPEVIVPSMLVEVTPAEGLVLLDPVEPVTFQKISAGSTHELTLTLQAPANGGYVLNVAVTLNEPAGDQTRVLAFPLLVGGSATPVLSTRAKSAAGGEAVVPLKGTESGGPPTG
jgi:hypothetical protein